MLWFELTMIRLYSFIFVWIGLYCAQIESLWQLVGSNAGGSSSRTCWCHRFYLCHFRNDTGGCFCAAYPKLGRQWAISLIQFGMDGVHWMYHREKSWVLVGIGQAQNRSNTCHSLPLSASSLLLNPCVLINHSHRVNETVVDMWKPS